MNLKGTPSVPSHIRKRFPKIAQTPLLNMRGGVYLEQYKNQLEKIFIILNQLFPNEKANNKEKEDGKPKINQF